MRWVVADVVIQALLLLLLAWLLPGFSLHSPAAVAVTALVITGLLAAALPIIYRVTAGLHPLLFPIVSTILTAPVVFLGGWLVNLFFDDALVVEDVETAVLLALGMTIGAAVIGALFMLDDERAYDRYVLRPLRYRHRSVPHTSTPGFIFLGLDGLAEPLLHQAMAQGYLPTLRRWLESGSHAVRPWEPDLSSQTSACQAGMLLGDNSDIPAFRWWDKSANVLMDSGKLATLRTLEGRLSTGDGLLADGGGSRWNLYSGDAPDCVGTFSKLARGPGQRSYFAYFFNPYVLARTLGRFIAEVVRERFQAWRQRVLNVQPRIHRSWMYALERAAATVVLQEAGAFMVAADMLRGMPSVYCTFYAYDEVAHHSGNDRLDSFKVLRTLDRVFARLERVAADTPRPYHLIVLSDHGQSQGPPFRQRFGYMLGEVVAQQAGGMQITSPPAADDALGPINAVLTEVIQTGNRTARLLRRVLRRQIQDGVVELHPEDEPSAAELNAAARAGDAVVLASGNLGLISFPAFPERMTLEQLAEHVPHLIPALASHPGISLLLVQSEADGGLVIGADGLHYLADERVAGRDPLARFGPHASAHLRRTNSFANAPDILVISMLDEVTNEVAAFEELVGSHGGLGGPQTQPFLLYPAALPNDPSQPIIGAAALHNVLKGWVRGA